MSGTSPSEPVDEVTAATAGPVTSAFVTRSVVLVLVAWAFANWVTIKVNFRDVANMVVCPGTSDSDVEKKMDKHVIPATYWGQLAVVLVIFLNYISAVRSKTGVPILNGEFLGMRWLPLLAFIIIVATYVSLCVQTKDEGSTVGTEQQCDSNSSEPAAVIKDAMGPSAALLAVATFALVFTKDD